MDDDGQLELEFPRECWRCKGSFANGYFVTYSLWVAREDRWYPSCGAWWVCYSCKGALPGPRVIKNRDELKWLSDRYSALMKKTNPKRVSRRKKKQ